MHFCHISGYNVSLQMVRTSATEAHSDGTQWSLVDTRSSKVNLIREEQLYHQFSTWIPVIVWKPINSHQNVPFEQFWSHSAGSFWASKQPLAKSCSRGCSNLKKMRGMGSKDDKSPKIDSNNQSLSAFKLPIMTHGSLWSRRYNEMRWKVDEIWGSGSFLTLFHFVVDTKGLNTVDFWI